MKYKRGIAVITYNRANVLPEILDAVLKTRPDGCKIVLVDDGSTDDTSEVAKKFSQFIYIRGENRGVIANKNRAMFSLQGCDFLSIIEDDLVPIKDGWFEIYEKAVLVSGVHHFCRVQDKEVGEIVPSFAEYMISQGMTPIYGPSPRGDLTFLTSKVMSMVGAFNPMFLGAGYGHGEWSERVAKAGLIPHPNKWMDIAEARDCFVQKGDTEGGRWNQDNKRIKEQIKKNKLLHRQLKAEDYTHYPLVIY